MVNIDEMQLGFVPGTGTTDAIFIGCQQQEKNNDFCQQTTLLCLGWPWEILRLCAREDPVVGLEDPWW